MFSWDASPWHTCAAGPFVTLCSLRRHLDIVLSVVDSFLHRGSERTAFPTAPRKAQALPPPLQDALLPKDSAPRRASTSLRSVAFWSSNLATCSEHSAWASSSRLTLARCAAAASTPAPASDPASSCAAAEHLATFSSQRLAHACSTRMRSSIARSLGTGTGGV